MSNGSSARGHFAIEKDDDADLPHVTEGIYVGGDGDISVVDRGGVTCIYKDAKAGTIIPINARRVTSTGTTATDLIGMYG